MPAGWDEALRVRWMDQAHYLANYADRDTKIAHADERTADSHWRPSYSALESALKSALNLMYQLQVAAQGSADKTARQHFHPRFFAR